MGKKFKTKEEEVLEFARKRQEWKENPVEFLKEVLGMTLPSHQKKLIQECVKRNIHLKESRIVALIDAFIMIYAYYLEVLQTRPVYQQDECFTWCKQFYDKCIKPMKSSITDELFDTRFCLLNSSLHQEGGVLFSVIPLITIKDFIEKLDNEAEDING